MDRNFEDLRWRREQREESPARHEPRTLWKISNPLVHYNDQECP